MGYRCYFKGQTPENKILDELCLGKCYGYNEEKGGAAIRAGEKYHKLHIKGRPLYFCPICVSLSEYTAKGEKNEKEKI